MLASGRARTVACMMSAYHMTRLTKCRMRESPHIIPPAHQCYICAKSERCQEKHPGQGPGCNQKTGPYGVIDIDKLRIHVGTLGLSPVQYNRTTALAKLISTTASRSLARWLPRTDSASLVPPAEDGIHHQWGFKARAHQTVLSRACLLRSFTEFSRSFAGLSSRPLASVATNAAYLASKALMAN